MLNHFGSPDGIYYGEDIPQSVSLDFKYIHKLFGLKVTTADEMKIVDKNTGKTENNNTAINIYVDYESKLQNPKLKIHLERRKYDQIYQKTYEKVDMQKYISTTLQKDIDTDETKEYILAEKPVNGTRLKSVNMKEEKLQSGTYRIVVSLYDNNKFIGSAYEYLIIK